jgi:hypothetical protein
LSIARFRMAAFDYIDKAAPRFPDCHGVAVGEAPASVYASVARNLIEELIKGAVDDALKIIDLGWVVAQAVERAQAQQDEIDREIAEQAAESERQRKQAIADTVAAYTSDEILRMARDERVELKARNGKIVGEGAKPSLLLASAIASHRDELIVILSAEEGFERVIA